MMKKTILYWVFSLPILLWAETDPFSTEEAPFPDFTNTFEKLPIDVGAKEGEIPSKTEVSLLENTNKSNDPTIENKKAFGQEAFINEVPDCTKNSLLISQGEEVVAFNPNVMSPDIFQTITLLMQYLYLSTKRLTPDQLMYPGNFGFGPHSDLKEIWGKKSIKIYPFFGTNGGKEGSDVGLIACQKMDQKLQIFVIWEGSQGEPFEALSGIGGASWMTNLKAKKIEVAPENLELPSAYNTVPYSFHSGFFNKIFYAKRYFERTMHECLKEHHVLPYNPDWIRKTPAHTPQELKHFIDMQRNLQVEIYIAGHSQGGGLAQIAAPYITTFLGKWLYGPLFDNKIFNIAHALCFSPARALGNAYTLDMVQQVLGPLNILGYCSPLDVVTCLPLGRNVGKDKLKELTMNLFLKIGRLLSKVLPKDYREACEAICAVDHYYETLTHWAYEDPIDVLNQFCTLSINEITKGLNLLSQPNIRIWEAKSLYKNKQEYEKMARENLNTLQNIQKNLPQIDTLIHKMQEHYFKAHTNSILISNYHIFKTLNYLRKIFKLCPPGMFISAQHFGHTHCYSFPHNGKSWMCLQGLFEPKMFSCSSQDSLDLKLKKALQYQQRKRAMCPMH